MTASSALNNYYCTFMQLTLCLASCYSGYSLKLFNHNLNTHKQNEINEIRDCI